MVNQLNGLTLFLVKLSLFSRLLLLLLINGVPTYINCDLVINGQQIKTTAINVVLDKLEAYSMNQIPESGLNMNEMIAAYLEFQEMPQEVKTYFRNIDPKFHLLSDFVLIPMEKYSRLIQENEFNFREKVIIRTETIYKQFRPLYLGQRIAETDTIVSRKTDSLVSSFLGLINSKPLNKKLLDECIEEYVAFSKRLDEIGLQLDIFGYREDIEKILNYLNRDSTKILKEKIFPLAHLVTNQERLEFLKDIYLEEVQKLGYIVINGQLGRYTPIN